MAEQPMESDVERLTRERDESQAACGVMLQFIETYRARYKPEGVISAGDFFTDTEPLVKPTAGRDLLAERDRLKEQVEGMQRLVDASKSFSFGCSLRGDWSYIHCIKGDWFWVSEVTKENLGPFKSPLEALAAWKAKGSDG